MQYIQQEVLLPYPTRYVLLDISMDAESYRFHAEILTDSSDSVDSKNEICKGYSHEPDEIDFGSARTRYLSSEVAGGFTGVMIGLYASHTEDTFAEFSDFKYDVVRE